MRFQDRICGFLFCRILIFHHFVDFLVYMETIFSFSFFSFISLSWNFLSVNEVKHLQMINSSPVIPSNAHFVSIFFQYPSEAFRCFGFSSLPCRKEFPRL